MNSFFVYLREGLVPPIIEDESTILVRSISFIRVRGGLNILIDPSLINK